MGKKNRTARMAFKTPIKETYTLPDGKTYTVTKTDHMSMRDKIHWHKVQKHR